MYIVEIGGRKLPKMIARPREPEQGLLMANPRKKTLGRHKTAKRRPPKIAALNGAKLIPFGWYGGKFSHLAWLLPLLPKCHHYCEPFGGSGAVLLNRSPSPIETYNDLDGEVVNFFRVLRDEKEKLVEAIGLTPFSREEFAFACKLDPAQTPLEHVRGCHTPFKEF